MYTRQSFLESCLDLSSVARIEKPSPGLLELQLVEGLRVGHHEEDTEAEAEAEAVWVALAVLVVKSSSPMFVFLLFPSLVIILLELLTCQI